MVASRERERPEEDLSPVAHAPGSPRREGTHFSVFRNLENFPALAYNQGGVRTAVPWMSRTMTSETTVPPIAAIREKAESGERLSFDEGLYLEEQADLFTLGELANLVRERKNGSHTY